LRGQPRRPAHLAGGPAAPSRGRAAGARCKQAGKLKTLAARAGGQCRAVAWT
jgi:hypothetical protein